ncbi:MAG: DUF4058 family protein [Chloroflexota bacterium]|nr:MAG: DUF4058 family protein [Chloroflexota bacterium]
MPSPFPGMDPYLEDPALWQDVHQGLITYIRDVLQPDIRPRYHARIGERLYVVQTGRSIYPDVTIVQRPRKEPSVGAAVLAPDTPIRVSLPPDEVRQVYVEIVDLARGEEVVTIIEVLSPANKTPGKDNDQYRRKQEDVLASPANLVEIDLLRGGIHTIAVLADYMILLEPWHYAVSISRAQKRHEAELYPINLRQRLPRIGIPLLPPDPDVTLDLQAVFERCYENGAYGDLVNYKRPPKLPLDAEDAEWAAALLKEKA